jgi:signal transduction histidine kinase
VRLRSDATHISVTVADDGVGIDPTQPLPRLSPHGGFGLHSAQAQVRALGGTLLLESGRGAGCVATVTLPLTVRPHGLEK